MSQFSKHYKSELEISFDQNAKHELEKSQILAQTLLLLFRFLTSSSRFAAFANCYVFEEIGFTKKTNSIYREKRLLVVLDFINFFITQKNFILNLTSFNHITFQLFQKLKIYIALKKWTKYFAHENFCTLFACSDSEETFFIIFDRKYLPVWKLHIKHIECV